MTCFHPLKASRTASGSIIFHANHANIVEHLTLPCGQCVGCRLARSRQWAIRCEHERQLHARSCFITLTYSDEWLPYDYSLDVSVFQRFMKRLRKRYGRGIRFFHCGEYGDKFGRPHFHAIIFGMDFDDRKLYKVEKNGTRLYTSDALQSLWSDPDTSLPYGFAIVGDVTFESSAYVARYILKKINGDMASKHYQFACPVTGEIFQRKPEYITMSRRPGIGSGWFDKFHSDLYPLDRAVINGKEMAVPKFYDRMYADRFPYDYEALQFRRYSASRLRLDDNTPDRLAVKKTVQLARLNQLKRSVDNDL